MKDISNQEAVFAKEMFMQLKGEWQMRLNQIAQGVNSTNPWAFLQVGGPDADFLNLIDDELEGDAAEIVRKRDVYVWPHPASLPKESDEHVSLQWRYNADAHSYIPRGVAILGLNKSGQVVAAKFGFARLMCLWICAFQRAKRNPSEEGTPESCILSLQGMSVGLERTGFRNDALVRKINAVISELKKVSAQRQKRLK